MNTVAPFRCGWPRYDGSTCDQPAPTVFAVEAHSLPLPSDGPGPRVPMGLFLCDTHNPERREAGEG